MKNLSVWMICGGVDVVNLFWLPYIWSLGCPTASGPPRATVESELWVLLLLISVCSGSSARITMPLSRGQPAPHGWQS